jgi:putative SOS response-associated peptidase YedK
VRGTPDQAAALMRPYAGEIEAWEVGAAVGNVKNNTPELMERVGLL